MGQIWKEVTNRGKGGECSQNMLCEIIKVLIKRRMVKSKHLHVRDQENVSVTVLTFGEEILVKKTCL